jgi:hypothetical protein
MACFEDSGSFPAKANLSTNCNRRGDCLNCSSNTLKFITGAKIKKNAARVGKYAHITYNRAALYKGIQYYVSIAAGFGTNIISNYLC